MDVSRAVLAGSGPREPDGPQVAALVTGWVKTEGVPVPAGHFPVFSAQGRCWAVSGEGASGGTTELQPWGGPGWGACRGLGAGLGGDRGQEGSIQVKTQNEEASLPRREPGATAGSTEEGERPGARPSVRACVCFKGAGLGEAESWDGSCLLWCSSDGSASPLFLPHLCCGRGGFAPGARPRLLPPHTSHRAGRSCHPVPTSWILAATPFSEKASASEGRRPAPPPLIRPFAPMLLTEVTAPSLPQDPPGLHPATPSISPRLACAKASAAA